VISGVRIQNAGGPCITIPAGATGVIVRDSDIGPCGGGEANINISSTDATIEYNYVHDGRRGILAQRADGVIIRKNRLQRFTDTGVNHLASAIEVNYTNGGVVDGNRPHDYDSNGDVLSMFESSNIQLINNTVDNVNITWKDSAGFTMGDSISGNPGANNYVARNTVRTTGGVPAGVFGSAGNTILEFNCLPGGIQAYNFSGVFNGVTVRNNVINMGASFVPVTSVISGWNTNVNSTDCALVPT
jgi:hypothetical protein